jgi:hypothetical protein
MASGSSVRSQVSAKSAAMTRPASTRAHDRRGCSPFCRDHQPCEPCADPGGDAEPHRAGEVGERQWWCAVCLEEWRDAVHGDEREVARRRRDQRGQQHAPSQVLLVRHLQGEDRTGGRCLEDGGDAGGRTRHQQHAPTAPAVKWNRRCRN